MSTNRPPLVKPGFPWGAVVSLLGSIAYGISPIDLIPDLIPLLGFVDDALAVPLLIIIAILGFVRHKKRSRTAEAAGIIDVPARRVSTSSEPVIPESMNA